MANTSIDDGLYNVEKEENASTPTSEASDIGSPDLPSSPMDESPEERARRLEDLKEELEKVEGEIVMLRQVLGSKVRHATELKRKIGITPFQEFKQDLTSGIQQIKSSDSYQKTNDTINQVWQTKAYQKTSAAVKTASEKTTTAFSTVGQAVAKKMGDLKNSQTYKSFDEKVHNTYASVKSSRSIEGLKERLAKVTGSRSSSEIDEAFRDANVSADGAVTTPEIADNLTPSPVPEN